MPGVSGDRHSTAAAATKGRAGARLRPLPCAALHGRRAHLPAGRQPPRLQPLPDARPRRDTGRRRVTCRCSTVRAAWAAPSISSAASRPRRSSSRAASAAVFDGDLGSMGQWNASTPTAARARRATTRRSAARWSTKITSTVERLRAGDPGALRLGYHGQFPLRERRQSRPLRLPTTGASMPRSASRPTPPTSTASTYTKQEARKAGPAAASTARSCRATSLGQQSPLLDWPQWDTSTLSWLSKTQARRRLLHQDERLLQHLRQHRLLLHQLLLHERSRSDSPYCDHSVGGFVEMGTDLIPMNTLKGAIHYRQDIH